MATGRFLAMIGALVWRQTDGHYLLLQRAATKDVGGPVTGSVSLGVWNKARVLGKPCVAKPLKNWG